MIFGDHENHSEGSTNRERTSTNLKQVMQHHSRSIRAQSDNQIKRSFLKSRNSVQLWEYFHHILKCGYFYKMSLSCQYYGLTTEVLERLAAVKTVCDWYGTISSNDPTHDWEGLRLIATVCYSIKHQTLPFFHYESPRYKPIQKLIGIHPSRLSLWALVKLQDRLNTVYILSINDCPSKMILGAGDVTGTSFPSKTKTYQYWCSQNLDPIHCWHVLTDFFCRVLGT